MRVATVVRLAVLALVLLVPSRARPACADDLRINEFCAGPARDWDGSGAFSSRDDEWIEIVNAGGTVLDLAGYLVTDGDSIPRLALTGALAPGERRVLFGRESYDWERASGYPAFGFSLGNGGDAVLLWRVSGADTLLVDAYAYRAHEAAADRAVGRLADAHGGFALFDGLNPYGGATPPTGTGCAPSPGTPNVCGGTPAAPTSWGRLKARYR